MAEMGVRRSPRHLTRLGEGLVTEEATGKRCTLAKRCRTGLQLSLSSSCHSRNAGPHPPCPRPGMRPRYQGNVHHTALGTKSRGKRVGLAHLGPPCAL